MSSKAVSHIYFSLVLFLSSSVSILYAQVQKCDQLNFNLAMKKAEGYLEEGKFEQAYLQLNAAKVFCSDSSNMIQEVQNTIFRQMSNQLEVTRLHNLVLSEQATPTQSLRILEHGLKLDPKNEALATTLKKILAGQDGFEMDADFGKSQHKGPVRSVAFSHDDKFILTGSKGDNKALLYRREGGLVKIFRSIYNCYEVGFSPDGKKVYLGFSHERMPFPRVEGFPKLPYAFLTPGEKAEFGIQD